MFVEERVALVVELHAAEPGASPRIAGERPTVRVPLPNGQGDALVDAPVLQRQGADERIDPVDEGRLGRGCDRAQQQEAGGERDEAGALILS